MAAAFSSVLEATAWRGHRSELGELRRFDDGRPIVVMEMTLADRRVDEWDQLKTRWLDLLPHHHILDATEDQGRTLLLRYAAIDWTARPVRCDTDAGRRRVATWGRQLVDVYMLIASQFPDQAAHFMRPYVAIDFADRVRVGFLPTARYETWIPRDVAATWPRCDERGLVYAIACCVRELSLGSNNEGAGPINTILSRALDPHVTHRHPTLTSLRAAFDSIAHPLLDERDEAALYAAEEGIGWLHAGEPKLASPQFVAALRFDPGLLAAREGLARCNALRGIGERTGPPQPTTDHLAMATLYEDAGQLVAALYQYERAAAGASKRSAERTVLAQAGIARCQLAQNPPAALGAARAALALDPDHGSSLSTGARAALALQRHDEAIQLADRRLALDGDDAGIHYIRGRALLARKRFVEARDAFDRAYLLEPERIEAMLLRREADRCVRRLADAVGVARPMTIDLPAHLSSLRDLLAAGRVDEVTPTLEQLVDDGAAQLVLAECLAYAQRYEEALGVYQRAGELDSALRTRATLSRSRALLFLERADEALAAIAGFEGKEANELRAMIRERLG